MKKCLRILAGFLALALVVCMSAAAEASQALPFSGPSNQFDLTTALYILGHYIQQEADATRASLENAGLTVQLQQYYDKPVTDHSHTSAFTLATGESEIRGETRTLAVITIRGTGDGEWYSNFDFAGESKENARYAENFMAAAQDIYDQSAPLLSELDRPVIVVTGYSRGAACANLLGVLLDADYPMEDVYVYTFATPNTLRGENTGYDNIFNLVNVNDPITRMPLPQWGFCRAGTDVELRDPELINTPMHRMFLALLGLCPDISAYYDDAHSLSAPGLATDGDGLTAFQLFQALADLLSGDGALSADAQQLLTEASAGENDFSEFLPLFLSLLQPDETTQMPGLFAQHMPQVYLELMGNLAE